MASSKDLLLCLFGSGFGGEMPWSSLLGIRVAFCKSFWDNLVSWSQLAADSNYARCVPARLLLAIYMPDAIKWMGFGRHWRQDNVFQCSSLGYQSSSASYTHSLPKEVTISTHIIMLTILSVTCK
jgi:hypothetical protein